MNKAGTLKTWASALFTLLTVLVPVVVTGGMTPVGWVNFGLLALNTLLVYIVPNLTEGVAKYAKGFITTATAVGTLLVSYFADGSYTLSTAELIQLASVVLAAVGVVRLPAPQWQGPAVSPRQVRAIEDPRP